MEFSKLTRRSFAKLTAASAAAVPLANFGSGLTQAAEPAPADKTQAAISGTPAVVKRFRIKFFFSLAKQDLFP